MAKKQQTKSEKTKKKTPTKKAPAKKAPTKKKSTDTRKTKPKPKDRFVIPERIKKLLDNVHKKYYKDKSKTEFLKIYKKEYQKKKKEYKNEKWSDAVFHKKAFTAIKNQKKRENLSGTIENFAGVVFGSGKVRDLSEKKRIKIIKKFKDDPIDTINDELILLRKQKDPETGEIKKLPLLDSEGQVIPIDKVEFFKRKDGTTFKNQNYGQAIPHSYRRTVCGVCINNKGIKGAFILELRDKKTELDITNNIPVKFTSRINGSQVIKIKKNDFLSEELISSQIESLEEEFKSKIITREYYMNKTTILNDLLEENEEEIILYKLRSSKTTDFIELDEKEIENLDFDKRKDGTIDVEKLYRTYYKQFTSDCSNLLNYHNEFRYIDKEKKTINWDEMVVLCDVNLLQSNMELSAGGNYTMYIEDDSLLYIDIIMNDQQIDSIKILVPGHLRIDFGQDSKICVIGSPFQFTAQNENQEPLYETDVDEKGKEIKIPILDYPSIMVYGIYAIPEYKVEIDEIDMGEAEEDGEESLDEPEEVELEETEDEDDTEEDEVEEDDEEEDEELLEDEIDDEEIDEDGIW